MTDEEYIAKERHAALYICYLTGQMTKPAFEARKRDDADFARYVDEVDETKYKVIPTSVTLEKIEPLKPPRNAMETAKFMFDYIQEIGGIDDFCEALSNLPEYTLYRMAEALVE